MLYSLSCHLSSVTSSPFLCASLCKHASILINHPPGIYACFIFILPHDTWYAVNAWDSCCLELALSPQLQLLLASSLVVFLRAIMQLTHCSFAKAHATRESYDVVTFDFVLCSVDNAGQCRAYACHRKAQRWRSSCSLPAGMVIGSLLVGLHMSATHGVTLGMMSSAIPSGSVPGLGRISGTAWSVTDLVLGTEFHFCHTCHTYPPRDMSILRDIHLGICYVFTWVESAALCMARPLCRAHFAGLVEVPSAALRLHDANDSAVGTWTNS